MLSKQAFSFVKDSEEPIGYLKFIFATTEIKNSDYCVSRCQRFDLSRIKSSELLTYLKIIKAKEKGKISDDVLKLIVKISEGSARDALSLLDRAMLSVVDNKELDLELAQKIFGYFDKSQLINLFELILHGNENKVLGIYRDIYNQGIDPKVFINDFIEILYYFKNIESLDLESINFSLNDEEFSRIKKISEMIDNKSLILFWQFTIKTLEELDVVSNQHLSIEMFLVRLMHIYKPSLEENSKQDKDNIIDNLNSNEITIKPKTINQIKNISQEKDIKPKAKSDLKDYDKIMIKSFDELIKICSQKKEIRLKYELENNINLVNFEKELKFLLMKT